ncbi:MAG TPA: protein kinase [Kofleriaceae bacterium]|jgi:serine/threonine protein kinase|nr:protein kinase [Kofleriaceae bacterium]
MRPELEDTLAAPVDPIPTPAPTPAPIPAQVPIAAPAPVTAPTQVAAPVPEPALDRTATAPRAPVAAAPAGLVAGQQLGHFRIEQPLGAGGMGEVYLATDLALERPVAIKVLPEAVARDPARRDRLVREARSQARITHPNVGHIYFIGEEPATGAAAKPLPLLDDEGRAKPGRLFFAMEYVAGETVAQRIAGGPLAVDDALAIIRSAALGLREAQRSGITHRDIKPSNLMIDGHGIVKVLDFGLAASAPGALGLAETGPVAQTSMAGTPLYMAPEQARGEPVDCRADIYALGATLFHLVAGRPPFEAETLGALLSKHASAVRPSLPRRSGQPRTTIAALDTLIGRMMAPAAADRFASYDELIRAIELASVDHMRPAGFFVRMMAKSVDLLLALLVALAMFELAKRLGVLPAWMRNGDNDGGGPMLIAYALGTTALIARRGRTPGQALFELEVIHVATGARPSLGRAALRTVLPIALPLAATLASYGLAWQGYQLDDVGQTLYTISWCLPVVGLLWAALRSVSKQTIWDRQTGTMVRYRTRRAPAL